MLYFSSLLFPSILFSSLVFAARVLCSIRRPGARLPVCGCKKVGRPTPVIRHRPNSGSTKDWLMRSDPSKVGAGREEVGSGGGVDVRKCFLNIIDRNGDKCHQNVIERHAGNGGDRWFADMKCYLMAIIQH